ncbi:TauD/TfdA family dioxygenase [Pseudomonas sp. QTF5]|uniref:TauD/TfdA family dioxygenase n=1 Tax=Pseudomonas sp. QTF5 TaxID=1435425 RepID=UPI0004BE3745
MHEQLESAEEKLITNGWAVLTAPSSTVDTLQDLVVGIARQLGSPRASRKGGDLVDHLRPTSANAAKPRSLSALYGTGLFPWHTDGAHWSVPPRYLVLACAQASANTAATIIWDARQSLALNSQAARQANFRVCNGAHSFYATATSPLQSYYRYDPGCMSPLDSTAQYLQGAIEDEGTSVSDQIAWAPGLIAIIDNWRCLHRRTNAEQDSARYLLRTTVME